MPVEAESSSNAKTFKVPPAAFKVSAPATFVTTWGIWTFAVTETVNEPESRTKVADATSVKSPA